MEIIYLYNMHCVESIVPLPRSYDHSNNSCIREELNHFQSAFFQ